MSSNKAIIYCSSNMEHPSFERRIRKTILENCGGLPIICVSQKPIKNFGKNIVVGDDIGVSGFNFFRQVEIALKNTNADIVYSAEADCCYPPDYFKWTPKRLDKCYRNSNLYVMGDHRHFWYRKREGATHSQVVGRKFYLETLEKLFAGAPEWDTKEFNFPKERWRKEDVFDKSEIVYYRTKNPVFQIKTHRSMRYYTNSERIPIFDLPYWGNGGKIRSHYLEGVKEVYARL